MNVEVMKIKEFKAKDKVLQKMTRDGAVKQNKATGEVERISKRDTAPVFMPQQPEASLTEQPQQLLKPPLPIAPNGADNEDKGTAERAIDRLDTERSRHKHKKQVREANKEIREKVQKPRETSRLQFSDEERADPALDKYIRKSDKAADKLDAARAKIPKQQKPVVKRTFDEATGKSKVRLQFEESDKKPVGKLKGKPLDRPLREAGNVVHGEIHKVESENAAVEGAHKAEKLGEHAGGYAKRKIKEGYRSHKLKPYRAAAKAEEAATKANVNALYQKYLRDNPQLANGNPVSKYIQKQKIRRDYAKAVRQGTVQGAKKTATTAKKTAQNATKTTQKIGNFIVSHKKGILIAIAALLIFVLLFAGLSSCGTMLSGGFNSIIGTSYTAEDNDITDVEGDYTALEVALRQQINNIESDYPGYDEYRYNVDEIGHDPFELASYLTAKFNSYTREQAQAELQNIFSQQYTLTIQEVVEVRYRTVTHTDSDGNSYTEEVAYNYYILYVTLKNNAISSVANNNLTTEQKEMYDVYMETQGNKPYLFEGNPYANAGSGEYTDYDIPPEALTNERFAAMIAEAEKYLGYPYVWGGSSPSTSFDCSGFVCWVINQSGVGSVGRTTATGLFNYCAIISPSEAQPGDLIFFTGTYDSAGPVSHVGIYVGNGMMIHCGNPISYASVSSTYWTEHFYAYGRLP
ncbi:MAG: CD1108 family mobile element protein [Sporomusa sp.]